jgi:hypothetical protein
MGTRLCGWRQPRQRRYRRPARLVALDIHGALVTTCAAKQAPIEWKQLAAGSPRRRPETIGMY